MSQAWFYKWRHGDASARHARREQLAAKIKQLFAACKGRYGSPRITAELREEGWRVSVNTVAQIMAEEHLRARPEAPPTRTPPALVGAAGGRLTWWHATSPLTS